MRNLIVPEKFKIPLHQMCIVGSTTKSLIKHSNSDKWPYYLNIYTIHSS